MYVSLTEGVFLKLTFQLFVWVVYICSTHSVEMLSKERHPESTDVLKFCQYALILQALCWYKFVHPFTHKMSIWFSCLPYISHFVSSDNLVLNQTTSLTCGSILRGENTYWSGMRSSRTKQGNLHSVDLFRQESKYMWKITNDWHIVQQALKLSSRFSFHVISLFTTELSLQLHSPWFRDG